MVHYGERDKLMQKKEWLNMFCCVQTLNPVNAKVVEFALSSSISKEINLRFSSFSIAICFHCCSFIDEPEKFMHTLLQVTSNSVRIYWLIYNFAMCCSI